WARDRHDVDLPVDEHRLAPFKPAVFPKLVELSDGPALGSRGSSGRDWYVWLRQREYGHLASSYAVIVADATTWFTLSLRPDRQPNSRGRVGRWNGNER